MYSLERLGWSEFFSSQCKQTETNSELVAARVAGENREMYRLLSANGEFMAEVSGKFRHEIQSRADFPGVGDWVLASMRSTEGRATVHRVLARKSKFSRKIAGKKTEEQIVAANVDLVFAVSSLNSEFNLRRLERYVSLAWESGATPAIVLNKCDLCESAEEFRAEAESAAMGVRVILASAVRGDGIAEISEMMCGQSKTTASGAPPTALTAALLGSSGVGKSSLINSVLGKELLDTGSVRDCDDKGRHTTTTRQLIVAPGGGLLIDTPGMRELQLWDAREGIAQAFGEIERLAAMCKFRDCKHENEPGCAVQAAVEARTLDVERLESFHKLAREEKFLAAKQDSAVRAAQTKSLKTMMKQVNRFYRDRGR